MPQTHSVNVRLNFTLVAQMLLSQGTQKGSQLGDLGEKNRQYLKGRVVGFLISQNTSLTKHTAVSSSPLLHTEWFPYT